MSLPSEHIQAAVQHLRAADPVMGALIERVSGKSFGTFLAERIFNPLGMKDTGFDVAPEKMGRLAKTYKHGANGKGFEEAEPLIGTWPEKGRGIESGGAGLPDRFPAVIEADRSRYESKGRDDE